MKMNDRPSGIPLNIKSISLNWLLITKILPLSCAHVRQVFDWTNVFDTDTGTNIYTYTQESVEAGSVADTRCKYRCQTVITFISDAILFFPCCRCCRGHRCYSQMQSKWDYGIKRTIVLSLFSIHLWNQFNHNPLVEKRR